MLNKIQPPPVNIPEDGDYEPIPIIFCFFCEDEYDPVEYELFHKDNCVGFFNTG